MNKFTFSLFVFLATNSLLKAQVNNTAGTTVTILAGTTVTLAQELVNDGTFTGNTGAPNSKLTMLGTAAQTVSGGSVINLGDFELNNTANLVTNTNTGVAANQGSIRVAGTLTFVGVNNKLQTSDASPISFTSVVPATNPTETNTAHILGTAIMESRVVGVSLLPAFLGASLAAGADVGNVTLTRRSGATGIVNPVGFQSIATHWLIDNTVANSRNITISWFPAWNNGKDLTQMQLWRTASPFTIGSPWTLMTLPANTVVDMSGQTHTASSGSSANLRNGWTVSDIVHPLPVEMLYFSVKEKEQKALLTWQTAVEVKLNRFEVEKSIDNVNFERIGEKTATGSYTNYTFTDANLYSQKVDNVYYRLKMIDNDNAFKYSATQSLKLQNSTETIGVYPNPFENQLNININLSQKQQIKLSIFDVLGREVIRQEYNQQTLSISFEKEVANLPKGAYLLKINTENQEKFFKLIKQ